MRNDTPSKTSKEDLKRHKETCWGGCTSRARLKDWTGYKYCLKHWYRSWRWGGGEVSIRSFIFALKNTKIIL